MHELFHQILGVFLSNVVVRRYGDLSNYVKSAFAVVFGIPGEKLEIEGFRELRT
jgi:hypothetical protein